MKHPKRQDQDVETGKPEVTEPTLGSHPPKAPVKEPLPVVKPGDPQPYPEDP